MVVFERELHCGLANVCTLNICDSALLLHGFTSSCFYKSCFTQVCGGEVIRPLPDLVQMWCLSQAPDSPSLFLSSV
ncbi:hypothetical protein L1987_85277 [Smallanthus sonchifolius]|uniref:Uncharacterized protein n=1 Tax=Smallanthus sonchifolius TaxID=185202 RepID=A0ACB8XX95_9ASTR|nr:hypothetical protein L1987_85277 [Smallanthus sonchifolius]